MQPFVVGARVSLAIVATLATGKIASAQCLEWTNVSDLPGVTVTPLPGLPAEVDALEVFDDGSGSALFVGGRFLMAGNVSANRLAKWDGASWTAVDSGAPFPNSTWHRVTALRADGPDLFVGGQFINMTWPPQAFVSRIGATPALLGTWTSGDDDHPAELRAFAHFDDGTGRKLFVGGRLFFGSILRRDGSTWTVVGGSGLELAPAWLESATVHALQVFDDGNGDALYAAGDFNVAGNVPVPQIARWNGSTWSSIGLPPGASQLFPAACRALTVFDDGTGSALYVAGDMHPPGPNGETQLVARWNGSAWSVIGSTIGIVGTPSMVRALHVFDDGTGPALYAAGFFTSIGGTGAASIAKWNGTSWSALGAGVEEVATPVAPLVEVLATFDDGSGQGDALYVGGAFDRAGGDVVQNFAAWRKCTFAGSTYCFGDGSLATPCPCVPPNVVPNPSGASDAGCANSFQPSGARLTASGTTNPDTIRLHTSRQTQSGYSMLIVGDASAASGIAVADGVRCASGSLLRFGAQNASFGTIVYPNVALGLTLPLSALSGVTPGSGATRYYQALYRDAAPGFCNAGTYNFTSGCSISW